MLQSVISEWYTSIGVVAPAPALRSEVVTVNFLLRCVLRHVIRSRCVSAFDELQETLWLNTRGRERDGFDVCCVTL